MKRHGIGYFNTEDGTDVRLRTGDHTAVFDSEKKKLRYCIYFYVTKNSKKRTSRTSWSCKECNAPLCTMIKPGKSESCFSLFHKQKALRIRAREELEISENQEMSMNGISK